MPQSVDLLGDFKEPALEGISWKIQRTERGVSGAALLLGGQV